MREIGAIVKDDCLLCRDTRGFDRAFSFAFQPIIDVRSGSVFAYEALVRGPHGEPATTVLSALEATNKYAFDQAARVKAVELGAALMSDGDARLSINIMPNAIYDPVRCLRTTLKAAHQNDFPLTRLMFEVTEHERVTSTDHLARIVEHYRRSGFTMAIDDFGAGSSGLGLLADFKPHIVKIDMSLVRNIDTDPGRQIIVERLIDMLRALEVDAIAEGIETAGEFAHLASLGVPLMQGFFFARPGFEELPEISVEARLAMAVAQSAPAVAQQNVIAPMARGDANAVLPISGESSETGTPPPQSAVLAVIEPATDTVELPPKRSASRAG